MKLCLVPRFLATLLVIASASPAAFAAREMFFIGNAVSNVTFENSEDKVVSGGGQTGCSWNAGLGRFDCTLPALKCRIMVMNPLGSQNVNVTVEVNHYMMRPTNVASIPTAAQPINPFKNILNVDLTYASSAAESGTAGWKGSMTAPGALAVDNDGSVSLAPNEFYIYEKYINSNYTLSSAGAPLYTITGYSAWPYAKWLSSCSGKVTVDDAAPALPGIVIANGSIDYYLSSYQNQNLFHGGFARPDTNTAQAFAQVNAMASAAGWSMINWAGNAGCTYASGRADCSSACTQTSTVRFNNYNGRTAAPMAPPFTNGNTSRTSPLQIGKLPLYVNGGMPF